MKHGVEVKICGLTNRDDAVAALDLGADYLGFILYIKSPRGITAAELMRILEQVQGARKAVGVFVNEPRANVEKIAGECGLYAVQVHGDEERGEFADMPVPIWRAVRFYDGAYKPAPEAWQAARYVVDAAVPGLYGGTGVSADWDVASEFAERHPVMLAGGLTPDNVANAVRIVKPLGVDVAGGVEAEPGKKDYTKLKQFIRAAKGLRGQIRKLGRNGF